MRNAHPKYLCYPSVVPVGVETAVTIFPRDLSAIDPMEIQHQKPLMTVVGGKIRLCPGA